LPFAADTVGQVNGAVATAEQLRVTVPQRPRFRGYLHTWTAAVAVPASVMLVIAARPAAARVGASIYGASVLALFGTSAAYHRLTKTVRSRQIMRRLDHSMIFVLIAGTYTPICLLALPPAWGIPVLSVVWSGAILGVVLKTTAFDRFLILRHALYPILGWTAIVALPVLYHRLSGTQFAFLIAGGLMYTSGIPVLLRRRPDPWPMTFGYHEVWHVFTVIAGICHFVLIGLLVASA
jgi:hemolysin III